ncbi:MAG: queuosine salvage family protein [Pseudomonadota bacterium]
MIENKSVNWGMQELLPLEGNPFATARSSCLHAVQVAKDVTIDQMAMNEFVAELNINAVTCVAEGSMGENCDTIRDDFHSGDEAANFALTFCILQLGHGYRYALHQHCHRGASKTITMGVRSLNRDGLLDASRLSQLTHDDIHLAFQLPDVPDLRELVNQLQTVVVQAGRVLGELRLKDFASFCRHTSLLQAAESSPSANLVQQLAYHFPAFNDQATLHDGTQVTLVKKATLAVGELNRLAAPFNSDFDFSLDYDKAIAPIDNVIPAMLVYHGILRLSPQLYDRIHRQRTPLYRGTCEAELRAVALIACERIVAATGHVFSPLNLGYFLWMEGKKTEARQFARHHTPDTIFY